MVTLFVDKLSEIARFSNFLSSNSGCLSAKTLKNACVCHEKLFFVTNKENFVIPNFEFCAIWYHFFVILAFSVFIMRFFVALFARPACENFEIFGRSELVVCGFAFDYVNGLAEEFEDACFVGWRERAFL